MWIKVQEIICLYFDVYGVDVWWCKDFWLVFELQDGQVVLMVWMFEFGYSQLLQLNVKIFEGLDILINCVNQCLMLVSIDVFICKNLGFGMFFVVVGLSDDEYVILQKWLVVGVLVDQQLLQLIVVEVCQVVSWECFFNQFGVKQSLVLCWFYEYLFLVYLYFLEQGVFGYFFQLVCLCMFSGQLIDLILIWCFNDDLGNSFYYCFWLIQGVIVYKMYIIYLLMVKKLECVQELFFGIQWNIDKVFGYGVQSCVNLFVIFVVILLWVCYQFMLDNVEYFICIFICGLVCCGQIVIDVICDNFWVVFQDFEQDLFVIDVNFCVQSELLLVLLGQIDELKNLFGLWSVYWDKCNEYEDLCQDVYVDVLLLIWNMFWYGNDNVLLSIFCQFDSVLVCKGLFGEVLQILWLMDYLLFE